VGSRFDDWVYWTSLLQLHLIITAHTLNPILITNFSLLSESQTGLVSLEFCVSSSFNTVRRPAYKAPRSTVPLFSCRLSQGSCCLAVTRSLLSVVICVSVSTGMRIYQTVVQKRSNPRCHGSLAKRCLAYGHIPAVRRHVTISNSRNAYYNSVQHIMCLPITVAVRSKA
jgi:hypothetical protein